MEDLEIHLKSWWAVSAQHFWKSNLSKYLANPRTELDLFTLLSMFNPLDHVYVPIYI